MISTLAKCFARTPLHPQWLLGRRKVPKGLRSVTGRLLDVGAADRWLEERLSSATSYVALDYPATGKALYGARPDVFANAAALPFPDQCFDVIVCLEVLEHVSEPEVVLAEVSRVLKHGGRVWISMPFLYPLHDAPFDFQRYTEFGLRRSANLAGLEVVRICRDMHALRVAGLLTCLALAGGVFTHKRVGRWLGMPIAVALVTAINLMAWSLSFIWPDWSHMTRGYAMELVKDGL